MPNDKRYTDMEMLNAAARIESMSETDEPLSFEQMGALAAMLRQGAEAQTLAEAAMRWLDIATIVDPPTIYPAYAAARGDYRILRHQWESKAKDITNAQ